MKWLTHKSRLEQTDECNDWILLDNEIYKDDDGSIYITPRNYKTDNYTVPDLTSKLSIRFPIRIPP